MIAEAGGDEERLREAIMPLKTWCMEPRADEDHMDRSHACSSFKMPCGCLLLSSYSEVLLTPPCLHAASLAYVQWRMQDQATNIPMSL